MNLRQIEAFRAIMLTGSATAAGELLRLTQPTISKLIAQLEHQTELTLFDRQRGRLIPRREAHALLKHAEKIYSALEEAGRGAKQLARSQIGDMRIASIPALGLEFFPSVIAEFIKIRPDVRVKLNVRSSSYVAEWVSGQQADIGFTSEIPIPVGATAEKFQERLTGVCLLPKGHPLASRQFLQPRDFTDEPFVSLGRDGVFRQLIDRSFVDDMINRKITVETNSFATACSLVAQGAGLSVVDPYSALNWHEHGNLVLRPFAPDIKFVVYMLRPTNRPTPLIVEEFLSNLSKQHRAMERRLRDVMQLGL